MAEINNNNSQDNQNVNKPEEAKALDASQDGIGLFFGEEDRRLLLEYSEEISNTILRESFILYRIDYKTTKTHKLYGESMMKNYLPPIQIFGRINVESESPNYMGTGGLIREGLGLLTAHVLLHHLEELGAEIQMGDFIYHKTNFYEVIDNGASNIGNEFAFGGDKLFYKTIKGVEVNSDVFQGR